MPARVSKAPYHWMRVNWIVRWEQISIIFQSKQNILAIQQFIQQFAKANNQQNTKLHIALLALCRNLPMTGGFRLQTANNAQTAI